MTIYLVVVKKLKDTKLKLLQGKKDGQGGFRSQKKRDRNSRNGLMTPEGSRAWVGGRQEGGIGILAGEVGRGGGGGQSDDDGDWEQEQMQDLGGDWEDGDGDGEIEKPCPERSKEKTRKA